MNILFIENNFSPTLGGVERVTYSLGESFRKDGHNVFYAFRGIDEVGKCDDFKYLINETRSNKKIAIGLLEFIKKNQIGILICQNLHTSRYRKIYRRIKSETNVIIVACLHSNPDIWVNKNKWGCTFPKLYIKEMLRSLYFRYVHNPFIENQLGMYEIADKFVLLSETFKPIFRELNKVDGEKLLAIPNPCPFTEDSGYETYQKENNVLVVARMAEQQKRIFETLKIWNMVYSNHLDWNLIIVGDGPDLVRYKTIVKKMNINNVEFIGSTSTPQDFYRKAKIFMMTSIWEGLPMTLIEAQHFGCVPIVYDSFSSVHDIIKNGENGFVIPLHNESLFVTKLNNLMRDNAYLEKMSINAFQSSITRFSISLIERKWNELFIE